MPAPTPFHVPWSEIDPALTHGGIPDGGLDTEFVGPRFGDNHLTKNVDMKYIFEVLGDATASLSMVPGGNREGPPIKNEVDETLKTINLVVERLWDRVTPHSNMLFQWTHATPPSDPFRVRPVRYPLRSSFMNQVVFYLLGTMIEFAESNANAYHAQIDMSCGAKMLAPLWHLKTNIMRDWFDVEVGGDISAAELELLFAGTPQQPGPTIVPRGEAAPTPSEGDIAAALQGQDVLQWFPDAGNWQVFANKVAKMYVPNRIFQPEGATGTAEDVAAERRVGSVPTGQPS